MPATMNLLSTERHRAAPTIIAIDGGGAVVRADQTHNAGVAGSSPAPATVKARRQVAISQEVARFVAALFALPVQWCATTGATTAREFARFRARRSTREGVRSREASAAECLSQPVGAGVTDSALGSRILRASADAGRGAAA
jgi:hypothetical protein